MERKAGGHAENIHLLVCGLDIWGKSMLSPVEPMAAQTLGLTVRRARRPTAHALLGGGVRAPTGHDGAKSGQQSWPFWQRIFARSHSN